MKKRQPKKQASKSARPRLALELHTRFHDLHAAWVRSSRLELAARQELELAELQMHTHTPIGFLFDVWGDGFLKPETECTPPPNAPKKKE